MPHLVTHSRNASCTGGALRVSDDCRSGPRQTCAHAHRGYKPVIARGPAISPVFICDRLAIGGITQPPLHRAVDSGQGRRSDDFGHQPDCSGRKRKPLLVVRRETRARIERASLSPTGTAPAGAESFHAVQDRAGLCCEHFHLAFFNDIRRHEVNGIAERAQQHSPVQRCAIELARE